MPRKKLYEKKLSEVSLSELEEWHNKGYDIEVKGDEDTVCVYGEKRMNTA